MKMKENYKGRPCIGESSTEVNSESEKAVNCEADCLNEKNVSSKQ